MGQSASSSSLEDNAVEIAKDDTSALKRDEGEKPPSSISRRPSRRSSSLLSHYTKGQNLPPIALQQPSEWKQALGSLNDTELLELILNAPVSQQNVMYTAARILQSALDGDGTTSGGAVEATKTQGDDGETRGSISERKAASSSSSAEETDTEDEHHFYVTSAAQLTKNSSAQKYSKNHQDDDDTSEELTALCFRILRISPTMAKLRFRLVPTKLKEHLFWRSLWTILYETLQQQEEQQEEHDILEAEKADTKSNDDSVAPPNSQAAQRQGSSFFSSPFASLKNDDGHDDECANSSNNIDKDNIDREFADFSRKRAEETIFNLRRTIERQEWKIQELQQELDNLKKEQTVQQQDPPTSTPAAATSAPTPKPKATNTLQHNGTWVMDAESAEFLEYPAELKNNLRMEKLKRLQEVERQMKFILDSDRVEDSNGYWSCCGQASYSGACTKG